MRPDLLMQVTRHPLLLKFTILESNRQPVTIPAVLRAQQASSMKPRLFGDGLAKHRCIDCFNFLVRFRLDYKINV